MRRKEEKVIKMKRKYSYTLGLFLFLFAIYILALFFQSFHKEHVSVYEVNQKQIAENENLRGIILRKESLIKAQDSGYINYYIGEGAKLAKTSTVYSISKNESLTETVASVDMEHITLSEEDTRNIRSNLSSFRDEFQLSDYRAISNLKYNIENSILELSDVDLSQNLKQVKKISGEEDDFQLVRAQKTGIISFSSDGLEELSIDVLDQNDFKEMKDNFKKLRSNKMINKGSSVYRVVTDENWSIVVALNQVQYKKLVKMDTVNIKIKKDGLETTPSVQTFTTKGRYYARLVFNKYMVRYLNDRYLDIEIQFTNADGLKIPKSSIVKKQFYPIPKGFIVTGGNSKSKENGIAVIEYEEDGSPVVTFIPVDIYYVDEDENSYIDGDLIEPGTVLMDRTDINGKQIQVPKKTELNGVYNCNQGYCKFQYINILYDNLEYAIVESGNIYSLSNYDHIVLNPEIIKENDIIY